MLKSVTWLINNHIKQGNLEKEIVSTDDLSCNLQVIRTRINNTNVLPFRHVYAQITNPYNTGLTSQSSGSSIIHYTRNSSLKLSQGRKGTEQTQKLTPTNFQYSYTETTGVVPRFYLE